MTARSRVAGAFLLSVLLTACGSAEPPGDSLNVGEGAEDSSLEADVTCPEDEDLLVTGIFEFVPGKEGAQATSEAAVHRHIQNEYPGVRASEARRRNTTTQGADRYEVAREGFRQLVLEAVETDNAWRVVTTAACEDFQNRTGRKL